jgi:UDP-glucose 4-epimerase
MKILVTGSAGFITGYLVEDLIRSGHQVVGIDNFSKYGEISRSYDADPAYRFVRGDAKDINLLKDLLEDCDMMVAAAERITAAAFDAALWARRERRLKRIVVLSSSMVFESTEIFPTPEGAQLTSPPPQSTYGFQKLACEYFARGAWEQYQLPYTIVRPFNCVGIGEGRALGAPAILSGNVNLAMSHVLPDLVLKTLQGQDPLRLLGSGEQVRHYTYGGDVARGIRMAIESERAVNEDFNISTARSTTVLELAKMVWKKINPSKPFRYQCDPPFPYDVQVRMPDVRKARDLLGFEAQTGLEQVLDEVIPWIASQLEQGRM